MKNNTLKDKTFYAFYDDSIDAVIVRLQASCTTETIEVQAWEGVALTLYEVFHKAAVRVLILEMNRCKKEGKLSGNDSREEYECFAKLLEARDYRNEILERYPELKRYLETLEQNQFLFWAELWNRLTQDWEDIEDKFWPQNRGQRICGMESTGADLHCGGKAVMKIQTDRGNLLLYKPHSPGNEIFLQSLLENIYSDLGWTSCSYKILNRGIYGWEAMVEYRACTGTEEVSAFYKRAGALAAVGYVLGTGDLHYENVIAHGAYPIIVDAETLFQYQDSVYQWTENKTGFYSALTNGLFPGGATTRRVAGITGGDSSEFGKKVAVIVNDRTADMRVEYRRPRMKEGKNQVRLLGKRMYAADFEEEILSGFRMAYTWFQKNKNWLICGLKEQAGQLNCRYLSGNTQFFGMAVAASAHPDLLGTIGKRRSYLLKICSGRKLGEWEARAMENGDIPYFLRKLDEEALYNGQGTVVAPSYFKGTVLEGIRDRLNHMSEDDAELQQRVLQLSVKLFGDPRAQWENSNCREREITGDSSGNWLEIAKDMAARIMELGIVQGDKIFWLGVDGEDENLTIRPVDMYFYSGISGIAVFFRKMYSVCGLYGDTCEKLETMLFSYTDRILAGEGSPTTTYTGKYCGEGSVIYAYHLLYQITKDRKYLIYAGKHAEILCRYLETDQKYDLLYGNAGAVLVLCRQYSYTKDRKVLEMAQKAFLCLDQHKIRKDQGITWHQETEGQPVCSAAHGNSGILLAYARMQSLKYDDKRLQTMRQILAFEDTFFEESCGNWADLRKEKGSEYDTYAWCNSGVGIVWARLQAAKWLPEETWIGESIKKAAPMLAAVPMRKGMCLCHGNGGTSLIIEQFCSSFLDDAAEAHKERMEKQILFLLEHQKGAELAPERFQAGMMNALAGIGLTGLLKAERNTFPDKEEQKKSGF